MKHTKRKPNSPAAYDFGLDFVGCEVVQKYFDDQEAAFHQYTAQMRMEGI